MRCCIVDVVMKTGWWKALLVAIAIATVFSSCTSYKYFPQRLRHYAFDSVGEFRLEVDPRAPIISSYSIYGGDVAFSYSPVNNVAFDLHAYGLFTSGQRRASQDVLPVFASNTFSRSHAFGGGAGFGLYTRSQTSHNVDCFLRYDLQMVDYKFRFHAGPTNHYATSFHQPVHTVTLQPGYRFKSNAFHAAAGLGIGGVFTKPFSYYENEKRIGGYAFDLMLQPGLAFYAGRHQAGAHLNWTPLHPQRGERLDDTGNYFMQPRVRYHVAYELYARFVFANESFRRKR